MAQTNELIQKILNRDRGINSVTNNSEHITNNLEHITKNSVTHNLATDPATEHRDQAGNNWITSSRPLGQDQRDIISQQSGINNIAVSGINVQLLKRQSQRPTFHATIQFRHQVAERQAMLVTVYTYPPDRLREFRPQTDQEQRIYDLCHNNTLLHAGRVMTRGRKGQIIDDLQAYVQRTAEHVQLTLCIGLIDYNIILDQEPSFQQSKNYLRTGLWGNSICLQPADQRISILDCPTRTGEKK